MSLILTLALGATIYGAEQPQILVPMEPVDRTLHARYDTMTVGSTSYPEQEKFAVRNLAYRTCPSCQSDQPFPGGELPDE